MADVVIDPWAGPKRALSGRVVTMNDKQDVLDDTTIYLDGGTIAAVLPNTSKPPAGFENVKPVATKGTIFPGLIELHNHLAYNVLPQWTVPKQYTNRDQWGGPSNHDYVPLISGPMRVLGSDEHLLAAVVRYVETKALVGGATTTQGVALYSNAGARRYYRGVVRNVEQTNDPLLPEADARIGDVEAKDAASFYARLQRDKRLLLHLSEGTDAAAREHFLALHLKPKVWALSPSLIGIHCAALRKSDFELMSSHQSSMVWSPLSNMLLYGKTAKVDAARDAGVTIGIGSDWSPTGSKNVLGELKVARLVNEQQGFKLTPYDIVAMATRNAAQILEWQDKIGTIERTKAADFVVVDTVTTDPYDALLDASETSVQLVMIGGIPRYGTPSLMKALGARTTEAVTIGGRDRRCNFLQVSADPVVEKLSLADATATLTSALANLGKVAAKQAKRPAFASPLESGGTPRWFLALDELADTGVDLRPHLGGQAAHARPHALLAAAALTDQLRPIALDPLTVVDDHDYFDQLDAQTNLPEKMGAQLAGAYT